MGVSIVYNLNNIEARYKLPSVSLCSLSYFTILAAKRTSFLYPFISISDLP